jgi:hypothetical protein
VVAQGGRLSFCISAAASIIGPEGRQKVAHGVSRGIVSPSLTPFPLSRRAGEGDNGGVGYRSPRAYALG